MKNEQSDMPWTDDETYTYSFEEDWQEQGESIPPRPDCLRNSDEGRQEYYDEEEPAAKQYSRLKKKQKASGVDPKRIKQLKTLYKSVVRMNREKTENSFVNEANSLKEYTVEKARHVPFRSYWPTYEAMSKGQREWYFYLRKMLREGVFPKTDLSYLFVYIYEIINQVGFTDVIEGFVQLCRVWYAYRQTYSLLDKYLVIWVQDYILIYAEGDFAGVMSHIPEQSLLNLFPDSLAGYYMESPDAVFPLDFISRLSDYRFHTGALAKSDQGGFFLSVLPEVFREINQAMHQDTGKGIFERYRPERISGRRRIPFQNAVYSGTVTSVCQEELPYSAYRPLRAFFTSIIRETENKLRAQAGIRGKLRGIELDGKVLSVIDAFILQTLCNTRSEEEKIKLEIDRDRIVALIEESNLIRQRLLDGLDETTGGLQPEEAGTMPDSDDMLNIEASVPDTIGAELISETEPISGAVQIPGATQISGAEPISGIALFVKALSGEPLKIVSFIARHAFEVDEMMLQADFPGVYLELEMDEINSLAMETVGDIMLSSENGQWILYEEYREELEGLLP